jgi:outer membrane protein assembly factor BamE (lipoprotein component of BamABCDE complex)
MEKFAAFSGRRLFIAMCCLTLALSACKSNEGKPEDGKPMRLGHDYGRAQETTEQWVTKLVVLEDPKPKIARFSPAVRKAIARGQLMKGMTREQVIIAVGYPQTDENPRLDGPHWRYWWSSFGPYYVYWAKGAVSKIEGHSETVGHMTYKGK